MKKLWTDKAWENYLHWQTQDKKTLKKLNELLRKLNENLMLGESNRNRLYMIHPVDGHGK